MFGVANIGQHRRRASGQQRQTFDCGRYGKLTRWQIAQKAGITPGAAWHRVKQLGWTGESLVDGKGISRQPGKLKAPCRMPSMVLACRLNAAFPDHVPTWQEIQAFHPMEMSTAKRWRSAMLEARQGSGESINQRSDEVKDLP